MSYAVYPPHAGLGAGSVPSSVGALVADAIKSVTTDSSVKLSPQSDIILSTAKYTLEGMYDKALQNLSSEVIASVSDVVADLTSSVVKQISTSVPLVGAILGWFTYVIGDIIGTYSKPSAEQQAAQDAQRCNAEVQWYRPLSSGQHVYPSDIFARYLPPWNEYKTQTPPVSWELAIGQCHPHCERSTLGTSLILATEYNPSVSATRKAQFKRLRQAIEAQFARPTGDGGQTLWPIYMDLLLMEDDAGHLTASKLLSACGAWLPDQTFRPCPVNCRSLVQGVIAQWRHMVRPTVNTEIAQINDLRKQASQIKADAQKAIAAALGKPTTPTATGTLPTAAQAAAIEKAKSYTIAAAQKYTDTATTQKMSPVISIALGIGLASATAGGLIWYASNKEEAASMSYKVYGYGQDEAQTGVASQARSWAEGICNDAGMYWDPVEHTCVQIGPPAPPPGGGEETASNSGGGTVTLPTVEITGSRPSGGSADGGGFSPAASWGGPQLTSRASMWLIGGGVAIGALALGAALWSPKRATPNHRRR